MEKLDFDGFNFDSKVIDHLVRVANRLMDFEKNRKQKMITKSARYKAVVKLKKGVRQVIDEIEGLDAAAIISLDLKLYERGSTTKNLGGLLGVVGGFTAELLRFDDAVGAVMGKIKEDGLRGRTEVLPAYAGFIALIAYALKGEEIAVGRGGDFEKICALIFSWARVPATPVGAITYFISSGWYADYEERFYKPKNEAATESSKHLREKPPR